MRCSTACAVAALAALALALAAALPRAAAAAPAVLSLRLDMAGATDAAMWQRGTLHSTFIATLREATMPFRPGTNLMLTLVNFQDPLCAGKNPCRLAARVIDVRSKPGVRGARQLLIETPDKSRCDCPAWPGLGCPAWPDLGWAGRRCTEQFPSAAATHPLLPQAVGHPAVLLPHPLLLPRQVRLPRARDGRPRAAPGRCQRRQRHRAPPAADQRRLAELRHWRL